jgi:hypothetical protein
MFSREELLAWIDKLQSPASVRKWPYMYASPDIQYYQQRGEEYINFYSGSLEYYEAKSPVQVDPILFWMHSAMWLSFTERGMNHCPEFQEKWDDKEEQNQIIEYLVRPALCLPLSVADFYERFNSLTRGRLPRAWENYEPLTEVMFMYDEWDSQIYMAKSAGRYITFSWCTTA